MKRREKSGKKAAGKGGKRSQAAPGAGKKARKRAGSGKGPERKAKVRADSAEVRDLKKRAAEEAAAREAAEKALTGVRNEYRLLVESTMDITYAVDGRGKVVYVSPQVERYGYGQESMVGRDMLEFVHEDDHRRFMNNLAKAVEAGKMVPNEYRMRTAGGEYRWCENAGTVILDVEGRLTGIRGSLRDITVRKGLEEQLIHSQRMEAVGRLAGGIAHDFNNLVTTILGHVELLEAKAEDKPECKAHLGQIRKAGLLAAEVTRKLLIFSRKEIARPAVLDLCEQVRDTADIMERVIGEDISLRLEMEPGVSRVTCDQRQLRQVLMNLMVNAKDAMPEGGEVIMGVSGRMVGEGEFKDEQRLKPGRYAVLEVRDTGTGMDAETKRHIFEPFFTTKDVGKGTGLGLSTIYGIVMQNRGRIEVESEPGRGTTFRIYLPAAEGAEEEKAEDRAEERGAAAGGMKTILLVEDEAMVRELTRDILSEAGYEVTTARNGLEGLELTKGRKEPFDLVVTDVMMPQMNAMEMSERILEASPGTKILYMSGYSDDVSFRREITERGSPFLPKPFEPTALLKTVAELLMGG
ncbi:MAG: response regulator [Planctomycetes bacterium]|nr:response regulator [Planctomycetota bacterium]